MDQQFSHEAASGSKVPVEASAGMVAITQASHEIGDIVALIDEIAFPTHLRALNAAVESLRAGDQGRGFTVVETEVRTLARCSAIAIKDIKRLVTSMLKRVESGGALAAQTGAALDAIAREGFTQSTPSRPKSR